MIAIEKESIRWLDRANQFVFQWVDEDFVDEQLNNRNDE
jgi:hypothetical protein